MMFTLAITADVRNDRRRAVLEPRARLERLENAANGPLGSALTTFTRVALDRPVMACSESEATDLDAGANRDLELKATVDRVGNRTQKARRTSHSTVLSSSRSSAMTSSFEEAAIIVFLAPEPGICVWWDAVASWCPLGGSPMTPARAPSAD